MFHHERELWVTYKHVAGFDEAGRGAWAGPVVAAAVVFEPECRIDGVDDYKKLSALKREKLYDQIISRALTFGVGIIDSDTVDRINILQATRQAMLVALKGLNLTPEYLLIDGNMTLDTSIQQRAIIDGDALSFIARHSRVRAQPPG
jgi:ribonuclease HII